MTNPATVDDVEDRMPRPLSEHETRLAHVLLGDAWEHLTHRRPSLPTDIAEAKVSTGNAVRVLASMVARVLKNPDGYEEEAIDDWRGRRAKALASGELHATASELVDVTPARTRRTSVRLVARGDE